MLPLSLVFGLSFLLALSDGPFQSISDDPIPIKFLSAGKTPHAELTETYSANELKLFAPQHAEDASVEVSIRRLTIEDVVDAAMIATLTVEYDMRWVDNRLVWNATKYNVDKIESSTDAVWSPSIGPCEIASPPTVLTSSPVVILSDGTLMTSKYSKLDTRCSMSFSMYPYDEQRCFLCLALRSPDGLRLEISIDRIDTMTNGSEWSFLLGSLSALNVSRYTEAFGNVTVDSVYIHYTIVRNSAFYVYFIILPLTVIVAQAGVGIMSSFTLYELSAASQNTLIALTMITTLLTTSIARAARLPGLGNTVFMQLVGVSSAAIFMGVSITVRMFKDWLYRVPRVGERRSVEATALSILGIHEDVVPEVNLGEHEAAAREEELTTFWKKLKSFLTIIQGFLCLLSIGAVIVMVVLSLVIPNSAQNKHNTTRL